LVTRASEGSILKEREIAEYFVNNGVKGIILWPMENDPNGPFFMTLSRQVPIVLFDRLLEGADLPAVTADSYQSGVDVCQHMFEALNRKRILVLMDNLQISPYQAFIRGLEGHAKSINRLSDITVVQFPISELCQHFGLRDFSEVTLYRNKLQQILKEGHYDALFCYHDDFLDSLVVETGLVEQFNGLKLATFGGCGSYRSHRYCQHGVVEWVLDFSKIIEKAADLLQEWVLTHHRPRSIPLVRIERKDNR
jgi:DNA-binding LacI/PurR family transcriptional regulator